MTPAPTATTAARAELDAFRAKHAGSRVSVVYGPRSREDTIYVAEADVAQLSVTAVTESLSRLGFETEVVNPVSSEFTFLLRDSDFVFVNVHGEWGEDGRLQGHLDYLGLPYTGSGVLGSAIALNKPLFKRLARDLGVRTPEFWEWRPGTKPPDGHLPLIEKPIGGGSSIGLQLLKTEEDLRAAANTVDDTWPTFLEEFTPGRPLTVAVLELEQGRLEVLAPVEVQPPGDLYDQRAKVEGAARYVCPAPIAPHALEACEFAVRTMCRAIDIRGLARFDFILDDAEEVHLLEANTVPGLSRNSNFVAASEAAGLTHEELVLALLRSSLWKP
jgi:D-alanine-D-alanine ligase